MTKKIKLTILLGAFLVMIVAANFVLAADFGVNAVNNGLGGSLAATDPRVVIGRIIQIALSFLGAIAVVIIMYAGFLWMSSGGDEEKITRAQAILRNAIIGLIIILASWGIATFILTQIMNATGGSSGPGTFNGNNNGFSNPGVSAIGACSIDNTYPANNQVDVPRNSSIMVTFKEPVKASSLCVNNSGNVCACNNTDCNKINPIIIRLYRTDLGDSCSVSSCPSPNSNITDISLTIASDNKTLILTPLSFLGSSNGNTSYSVKFTNQIKKLDDSSMFKNCGSDFAQWGFTVNSNLDLTPPIVALSGMFPLPDNEEDLYQEVTPAKAAVGTITVNTCPKVFSPAKVTSINPSDAEIILDYKGLISKFHVVVPADAPDKAQLFDNNNNLLGLADFNSTGQAIFKNYFKLTASSHPAGSLWEININPEQLADTLTVNDTVYTFALTGENNNIKVPVGCNNSNQALNIQAKLSGHPDINVDLVASRVVLTAKVAGENGNNITVATTNSTALAISPLTGGSDRQELNQPKDKKDRPMNSAIQINFNKAINPLTVSGSASEVANYIRVVNARASSSPAGIACSNNADCRSYKCENGSCVGNYLGGNFLVSNGYRTVEFLSDRECGLNGCGEKIYCLPANSHLAVELMAANLKSCTTDNDCLSYSPFKTCSSTPLGYKTCQNPAGKNYPTANLSNLDGIIDAAVNSFDGDRSKFADGPLSFYDDNYGATSTINVGKQDKYRWSFYINDQIMLNPPQITEVSPTQGEGRVNLIEPIKISFNTLMMNSTLRTGGVLVKNNTSTIEHKLINLRSSAPSPLGYWILNDNLDTPPLDGEPDLTIANIWHSSFAESLTFKAQVGSGVKDIYQNCYKPSIGPSCVATPDKPSCCFGTPTGTLSQTGNCP